MRVRGPKGAFRVEMQRETQKDRIILCRYDPTEPGDYRVEVRWAGVLVPGSPFPVKIVDTQDELLMLTQVKRNQNDKNIRNNRNVETNLFFFFPPIWFRMEIIIRRDIILSLHGVDHKLYYKYITHAVVIILYELIIYFHNI